MNRFDRAMCNLKINLKIMTKKKHNKNEYFLKTMKSSGQQLETKQSIYQENRLTETIECINQH